MTQHEHPFHYYRSPVEIREVQFSHRVRGVDEYEVAEFLDLLADQVHATDLEMERLRDERDRLREETEMLRSEVSGVRARPPSQPTHEATPQAATLLLNAQRVADDLVEEAVRRTRDMLTVARAEKNAILRNAQEAAARMLVEARDAQPVVHGHIASRGSSSMERLPTHDSIARESLVARDSLDAGSPLPPRDKPMGVHMAQHQRKWQLDGQAV